MKTKSHATGLFFALALGVLSCKDSNQVLDKEVDSSTTPSGERSSALNYSDSDLVLGRKLENPYSTVNMKKAAERLRSKGQDLPVSIVTNYYYVRFLPSSDEEYDKLNADTTVDLFEYPLDYEIAKQGNSYRDPSLSTDAKFTWLYAAIPVENLKRFDLKLEVLEELYLPFGNGKELETDLQIRNKALLTHLEDESMSLTGNLDSETEDNKNAKIADWYSSGRIRVWDERLNYNDGTGQYQAGAGWVPVPACLVRGNRWFTTKSALSYNNGYFFIDHGWPNGKGVNYSIKWDRADFDIRDGSYGQSHFNGPKIQGQWNLDISEGGTPDNYIFAHVHRAAWYYYYNNTFGVPSPPGSGVLSKMHLGSKQGSGRSHYFAFNSAWAAAQIKLIFDLNNDDARVIFGTTIHELTHASHWAMGMSYEAYTLNTGQARKLAESWAQAVGWHITREVYGHNANPQLDFDAQQHLSLADVQASDYTPLFIDLIDNHNQFDASSGRPNDLASGYTITQLVNFLFARPTNWYQYRSYLEDNSSNPTEAAASQLFSDYD